MLQLYSSHKSSYYRLPVAPTAGQVAAQVGRLTHEHSPLKTQAQDLSLHRPCQVGRKKGAGRFASTKNWWFSGGGYMSLYYVLFFQRKSCKWECHGISCRSQLGHLGYAKATGIPTENQAIGDDEHGDFTRRTQQLDTPVPVVPIRIGNRNDVMG